MFEVLEAPLKIAPVIQIHSGKYFDLLNPDDSDYTIEDIAWALSHINRFTGHTNGAYSVAQHSLLVSALVPRPDAMYGLLHDAAEAFLGDVSSPLKQLLPEYRAIEARVEASIFRHFGLPEAMPPSVKIADTIALVTERRDLMPFSEHSAWHWTDEVVPCPGRIIPVSSKVARWEFLAHYYTLQGESHG